MKTKIVTLIGVLFLLLCLAGCDGEESKAETTHEHTDGTWVTVKEATCTEAGEMNRICPCGEVMKTLETTRNGHKLGEWIVDAEATCTENGGRHKVCSVCGEEVDKQTISAKGHRASYWITDTQATCTGEGARHKECTVCGECFASETIAAVGHDWTEATCTEAEYCLTCETVNGEPLGHDIKNAACTRCGKKNTVVLFENSIVKITFNRVEKEKDSLYNEMDAVIYFDVENKTKNTISIHEEVISLNGYSYNDIAIVYDSVAADSVGTLKMTIEDFDFEKVDIYNIGKMSGEFRVRDTDFHLICNIIFTNVVIE